MGKKPGILHTISPSAGVLQFSVIRKLGLILFFCFFSVYYLSPFKTELHEVRNPTSLAHLDPHYLAQGLSHGKYSIIVAKKIQ